MTPTEPKNYEDIEKKQEEGIRGLRSPVLPVEDVRKFINDSRKMANRILYSEEEILVVAANRIKMAKPRPLEKLSWLRWLGKKLLGARDDFLEVNGQELIALMRLAGMEEPESIIPQHPYRVRFEYYKNLYLLATKHSGKY